ncbi:MAG TPA: alpha/beta fold hydrolase [Candidatus Limnocylindrales bacterium]|nr:alpha/beta fold hydrolase [Candidatus Limnocylindrales bacterium]
MPFLDINRGRLYYEEAGSGPAVVFVHAGIADHRMWDDQWEAFAAHYHVVRYDTRGYGQTTTEDVPYSNRADLLALLDHLNIGRATLIGCSRGGQIAADFALEHPDRAAALVLSCAGLGGLAYEPDEEMVLSDEAEAAEEAGDWARVIDLDVRIWVDGFGRPAGAVSDARLMPIREKIRMMEWDSVAHNAEGGQPEVLEPAAVGRLGELQLPALVVCGDYDTGHSKRSAEGYSAGIAGAQRINLPTAHLPNMELPGEFNRLVLDFLKSALV